MLSMQQVLLSLFAASVVKAHNWMLDPEPRNPGVGGLYGTSGAELENCGSSNTDVPSGNKYERGQTITSKTIYNNHVHGFNRWSIVPLGEEDDFQTMNDPNNFIKINCVSRSCGGRRSDFSGSKYSSLSPFNLPRQSGIPQDDSSDEQACTNDITFPTHLEDGTYVLQWVYYGVSDSDANPDKSLPLYRSCANVEISGGAELTAPPTDQCSFEWQGGDRALSEKDNVDDITEAELDEMNQCSYWKFNTVGNSYDAPGAGDVDASTFAYGLPAEVEACGGSTSSGGGSSTIPSNGSSSSGGSPSTPDEDAAPEQIEDESTPELSPPEEEETAAEDDAAPQGEDAAPIPSRGSNSGYEAPSKVASTRPTRTADSGNVRPTRSFSRTRRPRPTSGWWNRNDNEEEGSNIAEEPSEAASVEGQGSEYEGTNADYEAPAEDADILPDYQQNAVQDESTTAVSGEKPCKDHMNMVKRASWKRHFGH